jgi:hypothetical protein
MVLAEEVFYGLSPVKPKKIDIRPGNTLEGGGIVVWVYHRKAKVQLHFADWIDPNDAIDSAVEAWEHAMRKLV